MKSKSRKQTANRKTASGSPPRHRPQGKRGRRLDVSGAGDPRAKCCACGGGGAHPALPRCRAHTCSGTSCRAAFSDRCSNPPCPWASRARRPRSRGRSPASCIRTRMRNGSQDFARRARRLDVAGFWLGRFCRFRRRARQAQRFQSLDLLIFREALGLNLGHGS